MGAQPSEESIVSVQRRGKVYGVAVYDPATKRRRWIGTFATRKEAVKAEAQAHLSRRQGGGTVAAYAARWLVLHPRKRSSTMAHYRERLRPILKEFGAAQLGDISRVHAREWAVDHRSAHPVVRAMYADAIRDGLIDQNPFANMRLQQSKGRRDLDVMSVEQVDRAISLAEGTYGPGIAAFIATAAYCGMRPGELYALTWDALDFETDEIEVRGSYSSKTGELTRPKNDQQRRIVMFPKARAALLRVPERDGVVFRTITGKRLTGLSLHYYWNPVRAAIGRPGESFYALRHFCAAHLMNELGHEAEDVAMQLGHTDGGVLVRRLYGHPSEQLARQRLKAGFGRKNVQLRAVRSADREKRSA